MPVKITGIGSDMQGVGRLADGRAVFVPGALETETVDVQIVKEKKNYCEARLLNVLTPSPDRITPICPYSDSCGGCHASHMTYEASVRVKREKVVQTLRRVGGFNECRVNETVGMDEPFRYRNKAEYAISGGKIGFRPSQSREIIEIDDCLIQNEKSVSAMRVVRNWLKKYATRAEGWLVTRTNDAGQVMCVLSTKEDVKRVNELSDALFDGVEGLVSLYTTRLNQSCVSALDGVCELIRGNETIRQEINGLTFDIGPESFFQVNASQASKLYDLAEKACQLDERRGVIDAYCGVGTITLTLARRAAMAIGVESIPRAVRDARINAQINHLSEKTRFIEADAAKEIPRLLKGGFEAYDVIVDPPRKGVDEALIDAVIKCGVKRLVYVSCDVATLARDMKRICDNGVFEMQSITPVDMFPWTKHIECVTSAVRRL